MQSVSIINGRLLVVLFAIALLAGVSAAGLLQQRVPGGLHASAGDAVTDEERLAIQRAAAQRDKDQRADAAGLDDHPPSAGLSPVAARELREEAATQQTSVDALAAELARDAERAQRRLDQNSAHLADEDGER